MFLNESTNPIELFKEWLSAAQATDMLEPTAMNLATCDASSKPSNRVVLLKHVDEKGFIFFTNMQSRKGNEVLANPYASLCFYWMPLRRQVRVEGRCEIITAQESDEYFNTRSLMSKIGSWASKQSQPLLGGRNELLNEVKKKEADFNGAEIPRPPHWGGVRVIPSSIEFWEEGEARLHNRQVFIKNPESNSWKTTMLYP